MLKFWKFFYYGFFYEYVVDVGLLVSSNCDYVLREIVLIVGLFVVMDIDVLVFEYN